MKRLADTATRRRKRHAKRTRPAARINWRDLPPIPPELRVEVPRTPSQTFLGWWDVCRRAGYLYLRHRGGPGGHQLDRGTVFHEVVARLTTAMVASGQRTVSAEQAKTELDKVFAEHPEFVVPTIERDYLRMLVYHFAVGFAVDPVRVLGVEQMMTLRLGKWTIRAKLDLIEQPTFDMLDITDYKTQRNMPDSQEWHAGGFDKRGRPLLGGNYQTQMYALIAAFGETDDGFKIGEGVERFRLRLAFPAILFDGGVAYKEAEVSRLMLTDLRADIESQLAGLDLATRTGRFQPTPGSHCERCPAAYECPLPRHLRPASRATEIDTMEEAERLAVYWRMHGRELRDIKGVIKAAAERHGWPEVRTGTDTALTFKARDSEGLKKGALPKLRDDVTGAVQFGYGLDEHGDLDLKPYVTRKQYVEMVDVKVGKRKDDTNA